MTQTPEKPARPPADRKLTIGEVLDWLEEDGLLTAEQVAEMRTLAQRGTYGGQHPLETIARRGWIDARHPQRPLTLEYLTEWLAGKLDLEYFKIDPLKVDLARVTEVMPYAYAARFNVLPIRVTKDEVVVATAQPFQREWEHELSRIQRRPFRRVLSNPDDIRRYLVEFYTVSKSVFGAEKDANRTGPQGQNLEQLVDLGRAGRLDADDQHIVSLVDWLLQYAFDQRASDIHLEPRRDQGIVRFRIDGVMHQVYQIPASVMVPVASRLKILGRMDIAEKRRPQDGRIKTRNPDGQEVELRMSTMPTAFGEKLVLRIFDPVVVLKGFNELGFDREDEQRWQELISHPNGIILVTGPTGSGKTTTLYSTLKHLAAPEVNVCTVEDPIELVEPAFNQMQVHSAIGLDFASGVRTLLRQDPDIVMVGEIRDVETANMAVQAALTGHLVLSTLHTNDAPASITRLLDLGVPHFLLQSSVLGVIAQRLVRTLCPSCKEAAPPDPDAWENLVSPWKVKPPKRVYHPVGCLECRNTGFRGRTGIYEMMTVSPDLKRQIVPEADTGNFRRSAIREGMRPLRLRGAQKVAEGHTSIEEVLRVVPAE